MVDYLSKNQLTYALAVKAAREHRIVSFERLHQVLIEEMGFSKKYLSKLKDCMIEDGYVMSNMELYFRQDNEIKNELKKRGKPYEIYQVLLGGMRRHITNYHQEKLAKESSPPKTSTTNIKLTNHLVIQFDNEDLKKYKSTKKSTYSLQKSTKQTIRDHKIESPPETKYSSEFFSVEDLVKLIQKRVDSNMTYHVAKQMAETVIGFFGYQDRCIDNILTPSDRQLFYTLEDFDILVNESEETDLWDGKGWRVHYWKFSRDIFEEKEKKEKVESIENLYDELFSKIERRRNN